VYLLKRHNCRIKLGYKVSISVEFGRFRKVITFINSCNPWHRELKGCGGYVWIYRKCHRVALHVICGRHLVALDPFVSRRGLLSRDSIKIHLHKRCKEAQQTMFTETLLVLCYRTPRITQ